MIVDKNEEKLNERNASKGTIVVSGHFLSSQTHNSRRRQIFNKLRFRVLFERAECSLASDCKKISPFETQSETEKIGRKRSRRSEKKENSGSIR